MLAAMPAGAEGLDPQVGLVDDHLDLIGNLWNHEHRRERGVPPIVGIEWREANKAVHAGLRFGITIGIAAFDEYGGTFNASLLTRQGVKDLCLEAFAFGP